MPLRMRFDVLVRMGLATMITLGAIAFASSGPSFAASPLGCRGKQLSILLFSGGAGVGHIGLIMKFKNISTASCTLTGYPSLVLLTATGTKSVVARQTQNGYLGGLGHTTKKVKSPVVTLSAKTGVASILVEGTDVPQGTATKCVTLTTIKMVMPNHFSHYTFSTNFPGCSTPQVHPFVKGATGSMP